MDNPTRLHTSAWVVRSTLSIVCLRIFLSFSFVLFLSFLLVAFVSSFHVFLCIYPQLCRDIDHTMSAVI